MLPAALLSMSVASSFTVAVEVADGDPGDDEPSDNGRRKDEAMRSVGPDSDDTDRDDDGPSRPVFGGGFRGGSRGSGRSPFGPSGDLPEINIGLIANAAFAAFSPLWIPIADTSQLLIACIATYHNLTTTYEATSTNASAGATGG